MVAKLVNMSFDEEFLRMIDKRVKELHISRSEYVRSLVLRDLGKVGVSKRELKKFVNDYLKSVM